LPFTLLFVGSVQEEDCDGLCWHYIIDREKVTPDFVILTEPSEGKIARGQRGRMEIEIKVSGVSCHGSAPERGENAIYKLAPIITALERLNERLPLDPFLGKGTLTATRVRSNSPSLCAVADAADVYVDRRLTAGETPEGAVAELSALPEVRGAGATVEIPVYNTLSWRGVAYPRPKTYPAWTLEASHPLVTHAVHCYERLFGTRPTVDKWVFSTNGVATMGEFGIPTIGFGPGEERMAHAPNESVPIEDLLRCAAFYCYLPWVIAGR
jgi:putative selenium metabolism hydrolase